MIHYSTLPSRSSAEPWIHVNRDGSLATLAVPSSDGTEELRLEGTRDEIARALELFLRMIQRAD